MVGMTNDKSFPYQILPYHFPTSLVYGEQSSVASLEETHQNTKHNRPNMHHMFKYFLMFPLPCNFFPSVHLSRMISSHSVCNILTPS